MASWQQKIIEAALVLHLELAKDFLPKLEKYLALLQKWNQTYNLTGIHDPISIANLHFIDSMQLADQIIAKRIADVGSGAGFPGMILALLFPQKQVVLIEVNQKKASFLRQVAYTLALNNVEIVATRVENYHPTQCFSQIISRAFAELPRMLQWTKHLLCPGGTWFMVTGQQTDYRQLTDEYNCQSRLYNILGTEITKQLLIIRN